MYEITTIVATDSHRQLLGVTSVIFVTHLTYQKLQHRAY